jgi:hypothetical protein
LFAHESSVYFEFEGYEFWLRVLGLDQDLVHHSKILVQQNVAMKQENPRRSGISEIHPQFHARERPLAIPERNLDRVAHVLVGDWLSIHLQHLEVNLVDVEGMRFKRAVLDDPVFDCAHTFVVITGFSFPSKTFCFCPSTVM